MLKPSEIMVLNSILGNGQGAGSHLTVVSPQFRPFCPLLIPAENGRPHQKLLACPQPFFLCQIRGLSYTHSQSNPEHVSLKITSHFEFTGTYFLVSLFRSTAMQCNPMRFNAETHSSMRFTPQYRSIGLKTGEKTTNKHRDYGEKTPWQASAYFLPRLADQLS